MHSHELTGNSNGTEKVPFLLHMSINTLRKFCSHDLAEMVWAIFAEEFGVLQGKIPLNSSFPQKGLLLRSIKNELNNFKGLCLQV